MRFLLISLLLAGCASTPDHQIGLPDRPDLIPVPQEVWATVPTDAQDLWILNDLALKEWGKKLESRIILHDDNRN